MTDFKKMLAGMTLPSWMNRGEPAALLRAARRFWEKVWSWVNWPLNQFDPLTCSESLLGLLAWQRDITRFNGEGLALYRRRVAYAFINARDAGSVAGFIAIFRRLGIGYVELQERQPGIDWDVITVRVTDGQLSENPELLMLIIQQYGRTCRRYRFEVITANNIAISAGWYGGEYIVYTASTLAATTTNRATFGAKLGD
ncbi:phage tail protein [Erwinia aphidicola]|uniref:phage tail protein n=1 Tax=Erwinia aphidicola TaxID=68334 RepID=UPI00301670FD